jgi:hypothetical protein
MYQVNFILLGLITQITFCENNTREIESN